jgi:hypothetical protein
VPKINPRVIIPFSTFINGGFGNSSPSFSVRLWTVKAVFAIIKNMEPIIVTSKEALIKLQAMGVEIGNHQWHNWVGSGKVYCIGSVGDGSFDSQHIEEVGKRYIESNGRAYSVYRYDHETNRQVEYVNSYQCGNMWHYTDRQAQNILASGKVPSLMIGNELFVDKRLAEAYQADLLPQQDASEKHPDKRQ